MDKLMFRVYRKVKGQKKELRAAFVVMAEAITYCNNKLDYDIETVQYIVMQGNRNRWKYPTDL